MTNKDKIEELEEIRKKNPKGLLMPQDVVDAASREESPLHDEFEWDDRKAGNEYRLWQAREVICRVKIVMGEQKKVEVRMYVNLSSTRNDGGGYQPVANILTDKDLARRALLDLLEDLDRLRIKYQHIEMVVLKTKAIWKAVEEAKNSLKEKKKTKKNDGQDEL
jgi:hypothetical protein